MADLAKAYVQIIPSAEGIQSGVTKILNNETGGAAEKAGSTSGKNFAGSLAKGIIGGVAAVGAATTALVGGLVKGAQETAAYGDQIDKTSQKLGLSTEAYQKWDYVLNLAGSSMQSAQMGLKTLTNKVDDAKNGSETAIAQFEALGISIEDLSSMSREEIFQATIAGFQGMEESAERAAIANDLLGRAGAELTPLFNQTAAATQEQLDLAEQYGFVMSDEMVKASAAFNDSMTTLQNTITGLKNSMLGELLPSMTMVTDGLAAIFAGDMSGLDSINEGVDGFVQKLADLLPTVLEVGSSIVLNLATGIINNLPKILTAALDIVLELANGILEALPQIVSVALDIVTALLTGIGQALPQLLATVATVVVQIVQTLIQNLPQLIQGVIALAQGVVAGVTQIIPVLLEAIPPIITALLQAIPDIIDALAAFIADAAPMLIDMYMDLFEMLWTDVIPAVVVALVENLPKILESLINFYVTAYGSIFEKLGEVAGKIGEWLGELWGNFKEWLAGFIPQLIEWAKNLATGASDAGSGFIGKLVTFFIQIPVKLGYHLGKALGTVIAWVRDFVAKAKEAGQNFINNVVNFVKDLPEKLKSFLQSAMTALLSFPSKMATIGKNLVEGLWNGIKNMTSWMTDKVKGFANSILSGIKSALGIHSPSTEGAWIGKMFDLGIAGGIEDNVRPVQQAISDVADSTAGILPGEMAVRASVGNASGSVQMAQLIALVANLSDRLDKMQVVLDTGAVVGGLTPGMDGELSDRTIMAGRGLALT